MNTTLTSQNCKVCGNPIFVGVVYNGEYGKHDAIAFEVSKTLKVLVKHYCKTASEMTVFDEDRIGKEEAEALETAAHAEMMA